MTRRALIVSLHDVSPLTRTACTAILAELAALGLATTSILIIPDHHCRGHFLADPEFCASLVAWVNNGHEPVIHGYFHRRESGAGEGARARFLTRHYTAGEGEFYDLDRSTAADLIGKARAEFQTLGLNPAGFIAPAWLLSADAEHVLRDLNFAYTTRLGSVLDLRENVMHHSQSLVWSVRSGWRRAMSLAWNAFLFQRLANAPLLRISIHPPDWSHPRIRQQIRELIRRALADRAAHTYESWLRGQKVQC